MSDNSLEQVLIEEGTTVIFNTNVPVGSEIILKTKGGTIVKFRTSLNNPAEIFSGNDIESCTLNIGESVQELTSVK
ncbi:hypothetical protein D172_001665 [Pseudoalteromonas sp. Bsw20308]|uniref:hypothetical protein n=1 Tax=Pseudoalteromonas sp. Bsw20308 TaxID=283699 RepID=UPI00051811F7|nr:hypothetical protein [Pseudoalteromonas sp. Bsw20308]ALQ06868.1 hypothetical protein D172_001665 [Pseudoalteromonas sp. Bsw20308]